MAAFVTTPTATSPNASRIRVVRGARGVAGQPNAVPGLETEVALARLPPT